MEHMLSCWQKEQRLDAALMEAQIQTWRDWLENERRAIVPAEDEQFKILKKTPKASVEELLAGAHLPGKILTSLRQVATDGAPQPEEEAQRAVLMRFIANDRSEREVALVQYPYSSWLTAWYFNTEKTSLSLRQYALAAAKDWIRSAADDIQGETIQKFPDSITFYSDLSYEGHTSTLRFQTLDGKNEREELKTLHTIIDAWQKEELKKYRPGWSVFLQLFLLIGGGGMYIQWGKLGMGKSSVYAAGRCCTFMHHDGWTYRWADYNSNFGRTDNLSYSYHCLCLRQSFRSFRWRRRIAFGRVGVQYILLDISKTA